MKKIENITAETNEEGTKDAGNIRDARAENEFAPWDD